MEEERTTDDSLRSNFFLPMTLLETLRREERWIRREREKESRESEKGRKKTSDREKKQKKRENEKKKTHFLWKFCDLSSLEFRFSVFAVGESAEAEEGAWSAIFPSSRLKRGVTTSINSSNMV